MPATYLVSRPGRPLHLAVWAVTTPPEASAWERRGRYVPLCAQDNGRNWHFTSPHAVDWAKCVADHGLGRGYICASCRKLAKQLHSYSDGTLSGGTTIHTYTPPEPAPWWETCDGDAMVTYTPDYVDGLGSHVVTAKRYRTFDRPDADFRNPRRVHVSDYDSTVPVPRDALERLREKADAFIRDDSTTWRERNQTAYNAAIAAAGFLVAVDETGGEK